MAETGRQTRDLTPAQRRAVAALLTERTARAAAEKAEIAERTLYRWLTHDDFQAALHAAEADLLASTTRQLLSGTTAAVGVVATIMTGDAPAGVRLRAAQTLLDQAHTWYTTKTLEERLSRLEAMYDQNTT